MFGFAVMETNFEKISFENLILVKSETNIKWFSMCLVLHPNHGSRKSWLNNKFEC